MKLAEAATRWAAAKRVKKKNDAEIKATEKILKGHFRKSGRATYRDLISYVKTPTTRLDTDKVRAELADRIAEFEVAGDKETLSLLKP